MGVDRYEDLPVASMLVPARRCGAVRKIYRYERTANDIAGEGDAPVQARLATLAALRGDLDRIEAGTYPAAMPWSALAAAIARHRLPVEQFRELLNAFEQDARGAVYRNHDDRNDYCRYSAKPVGRLLLNGRTPSVPGCNW